MDWTHIYTPRMGLVPGLGGVVFWAFCDFLFLHHGNMRAFVHVLWSFAAYIRVAQAGAPMNLIQDVKLYFTFALYGVCIL